MTTKSLTVLSFLAACLLGGCAGDPVTGSGAPSENGNRVSSTPVAGATQCRVPDGSNGRLLARGKRYSAPSLDWLAQEGWHLQPQTLEATTRAYLGLNGVAEYMHTQTALNNEEFSLNPAGIGRRYKVSMLVRSASAAPAQINWALFSNLDLETHQQPVPVSFELPASGELNTQWQVLEGVFDNFAFGNSLIRMQSQGAFEYKDIRLEELGDSSATGNLYVDAIWLQGLRNNSAEKLIGMIEGGWELTGNQGINFPLEQKLMASQTRLEWPKLDAVVAKCQQDSASLSKHFTLISSADYSGGYQLRLTIDGPIPAGLVLHTLAYYPSQESNDIFVRKVISPNSVNTLKATTHQVVFNIDSEGLPDMIFYLVSPFTPFKVDTIALNRLPVE